MEFEYDPFKSQINEIKHQIIFEEAQELWLDGDRLVIPARSDSEPRYALLAQRKGGIWAAFYTLRGDTIRIISVRHARDNEKQLYDSGRTG